MLALWEGTRSWHEGLEIKLLLDVGRGVRDGGLRILTNREVPRRSQSGSIRIRLCGF